MASHIEKCIEELEEKKERAREAYEAEAAKLDAGISTLRRLADEIGGPKPAAARTCSAAKAAGATRRFVCEGCKETKRVTGRGRLPKRCDACKAKKPAKPARVARPKKAKRRKR